jgi:hypothetical protein
MKSEPGYTLSRKDARKTTTSVYKLTTSSLEAGYDLNFLADAASRGVAALPVCLVCGGVVGVLQSSVTGGSGGAHHSQDGGAAHGHLYQERWSARRTPKLRK